MINTPAPKGGCDECTNGVRITGQPCGCIFAPTCDKCGKPCSLSAGESLNGSLQGGMQPKNKAGDSPAVQSPLLSEEEVEKTAMLAKDDNFKAWKWCNAAGVILDLIADRAERIRREGVLVKALQEYADGCPYCGEYRRDNPAEKALVSLDLPLRFPPSA